MESWDSTGGSSEQVQLRRVWFPSCLSLSVVEDPPFLVSAPASGAPAGRLGPRVQMGNCMPNHPFRHPTYLFSTCKYGFFADGFNIFVASPFYLKQNKRPTMSVEGNKQKHEYYTVFAMRADYMAERNPRQISLFCAQFYFYFIVLLLLSLLF